MAMIIVRAAAFTMNSKRIILFIYKLDLNWNPVLPLALLDDPLFSMETPRYLAMGTLGFIMAHEIMHGFDNSGILQLIWRWIRTTFLFSRSNYRCGDWREWNPKQYIIHIIISNISGENELCNIPILRDFSNTIYTQWNELRYARKTGSSFDDINFENRWFNVLFI